MDNFLMNLQQQTITSLELLEQINFFRWKEGNKTPLRHDNLRAIIKDEFEEEILSLKIQEKSISSNGGRPIKVYILTLAQGRQVLMRESKFVRKGVIEYIESLEKRVKQLENYSSQEELKYLKRKNELLELENKLLKAKVPREKSSLKITFDPTREEKVLPVIASKRGLVKRIAQNDPSYFSDNQSYFELYQAFESKYKIDLEKGIKESKRSIATKAHYIDKDLKMINEFLEIAIELYPKGYEKVKELYKLELRKLKENIF